MKYPFAMPSATVQPVEPSCRETSSTTRSVARDGADRRVTRDAADAFLPGGGEHVTEWTATGGRGEVGTVPRRHAGSELIERRVTVHAPMFAAAAGDGQAAVGIDARTRAALDLAAKSRPPVDQADAADWLESRLQTNGDGALHLVFHTVAWQYFPTQTQTRALAALAQAGRRSPVARLSMEADGQTPGAALTLTLWPEGEIIPLGRADFHGRWVDWQAPSIDRALSSKTSYRSL